MYEPNLSLQEVIDDIKHLPDGGTLAVFLGIHALKRGYSAQLFSYNLQIFDPTWANLSSEDLAEKLRQQYRAKRSRKLRLATVSYIEFLALGGEILFEELSGSLIRRYLSENTPVLTGLSATYLYQSKREISVSPTKSDWNDVLGFPQGHFVVLSGLDEEGLVEVADPYKDNPVAKDHYYHVTMRRLLNAILLGVITYDANLLILKKPWKNLLWCKTQKSGI